MVCTADYSGSTANDILYLGSASSTAGFFGGKIDDFRIYGYARSPDQVKIDYNAGFGIKLGGSPSQINWTYETQWPYKREITISGSTEDLTDYQISLTLDTQSLISQGKMRSDCGDIRVGDSTGKVLNYWIEPNTCNTTSTKIWVKVPSIPTSGTTIYLYYGNSSVSSESNAQNTFIRIIDGVVGNWHFDEGSGSTAYDSSGNDNDGTLTNGPQWVDGKYGKALSFDGSDDYVDIDHKDCLNMTGDHTLMIWIKPVNWNDGSHRCFFAKGDRYFYRANYYMGKSKGNFLKYTWYSSGWRDITYNYQPPDNVWTQLAYVVNYSSNSVSFYANGVFLSTENADFSSYPVITNSDPLYIGGYKNDEGTYEEMNADIDEVLIYNRALSAEEISDLYNNYGYTTENYPGKVLVRKYTSPEPTVTVGDEQSTLMPQILLHFGEGSGSTAYDATPHNNDCTLSGTSFKKGILGTGLYFSGSASSSCGDIGDIKTLSFFVNPLSLNQPILDLDGGTHYIELSSGKIHLAGNNWQSPKLYV
ncbi:DUF2341 domain-containing protein, partial [bacterium]|nr:DUF2341 domain-containing protein [bacterium]